MASYSLGCDALDHIGQRRSLPRLHFDEAADSVGDLLPPAVPNCNRQCHQIVLRSRLLGCTNRSNNRLREEIEATDGLYPDAFLMHEGIVSNICYRDTAGSAAALAASCRKFRRGSFILNLPLPSHHSITSSAKV
jgi:hypothetical protein